MNTQSRRGFRSFKVSRFGLSFGFGVFLFSRFRFELGLVWLPVLGFGFSFFFRFGLQNFSKIFSSCRATPRNKKTQISRCFRVSILSYLPVGTKSTFFFHSVLPVRNKTANREIETCRKNGKLATPRISFSSFSSNTQAYTSESR